VGAQNRDKVGVTTLVSHETGFDMHIIGRVAMLNRLGFQNPMHPVK
jgi:hypothetical protein